MTAFLGIKKNDDKPIEVLKQVAIVIRYNDSSEDEIDY